MLSFHIVSCYKQGGYANIGLGEDVKCLRHFASKRNKNMASLEREALPKGKVQMKTISLKIVALGLALGLGAILAPSMKAESTDTTKGARLMTPLRTVEDFQNLTKGDKIVAYCPMMKETFITTIRDVDSKGHATITETKKGLEVGGCEILLQKDSDSKEVKTLMVCPDGKVRPVVCSKM